MARIPVVIPQSPSLGPSSQVTGPAQPRMVYPDRRENDVQNFQRGSTARAKALPFGNGNYLQGVSFTALTPITLAHGLGVANVGFMAMNFVGSVGRVWSTALSAALSASYIALECDTTCTCDIWVYQLASPNAASTGTTPAGPGVTVQDAGTTVVANATVENFTGSGVTVTGVAGVATINIPGSSTVVPAQVGLSIARPSATGSGKLYVCTDVPLVYVDDPTTEAWQQFTVADTGKGTAPGAIAGWTAIGCNLVQKADSILALQSPAGQHAAILKPFSGSGFSGSGSWIVTAALVPYLWPVVTSTGQVVQIGVCVSNGTTSGTSVMYGFGLYWNPDSNAGSILITNVTLGGGSGGWSAASTLVSLVPFNGVHHLRLLSDGTTVLYQVSNDGGFWRTLTAVAISGDITISDWGAAIDSGGTSAPNAGWPGAMAVEKLFIAATTTYAVTGGSGTTTTTTLFMASTTGIVAGMLVTVRGMTASSGTPTNGGEFIVESVSAFNITYASSGIWVWGSGGTVTLTSV
jgi:hypothetical protein